MKMKILTFIAFALCMPCITSAQKLVKIGKGYSGTSINTTVFRNNSVVTHKNLQFACYYDSAGYVVLAKRKLGEQKWETRRSQYQGKIQDAHNVISMMIDGEGYIHIAFDHHGNPLNYCRSVAPLSLELSEKTSMLGVNENKVTYPEFYLLSDGDLLFVYRTGSSGNGKMIMNYYSVKKRQWERIQDVLIDGENERNAYWQLCVDKQGVIHVSWVWRETGSVDTNHDLCYARSYDNGKTWQKTNGEIYNLPITANTAEYVCRIPQKSELINQTSMSTDNEGNPFIATYWRSKDSLIPQYRLVYHDGKQWNVNQISNRKTAFTLKGSGTKMIPISRPRIVTDGKRGYYLFRDEERGSKVSVAITNDIHSNQWTIQDLTEFSVNAWEPTYDTELWKQKNQLHIFVQCTGQGDGGGSVNMHPQPIYILEFQ